MHVASGAAGGSLVGSRAAAVGLGMLLHFIGDRIPHEDVKSRRFEAWCGAAGVLSLAATRGLLHPVTLGAAASTAPDLEHVLPLPRPRGRKLFPSHRIPGWHRPGGISTDAQLLLAGVLFGSILAAGLKR